MELECQNGTKWRLTFIVVGEVKWFRLLLKVVGMAFLEN